ncbi:olfactomedin-4-like [Acanthochromis polyacanthus]|uniref:olfactomedin-4-like n=1 Tax=Acanthochromis polyacanthus TaxID=80966 RepID=UPI002234DC43|nr:olfactomedin-4-like [Acanthochromis polyacanthus]
MESPSRSPPRNHSDSKKAEHSEVLLVQKNRQSVSFPIRSTKSERGDPLILWRELQLTGAQPGACEYPHTCPVALTLGISRKGENPTPHQDSGSRTLAVCGGSQGNNPVINKTDVLVSQLTQLKAEMEDLEQLDSMEVVKERRNNHRLRTSLNRCLDKQNATIAPIQPPYGTCSQGLLKNVTGPVVQTAGEYPGSYPYGSWGRDPKPEPGKERWYWMVPMTTSNRYNNYVRLYHSLYKLIGGETNIANILISSSNPTTNTIQGPNVVLYGGSLYYNCYNQRQVCRFHLTTKTVTNVDLPQGTRYNSKGNFCHLDECYPYTDLDLATDESGVWVVYTTTQNFGNLVLSKLEEGEPPKLNQTWHTSVFKQGVTNTFMACGVLYATRYVSKNVEEIFYSFDTTTGKERFDVGIFMNKMATNIQALNYSPVDQMLHAYCDSKMVSYKVLFG